MTFEEIDNTNWKPIKGYEGLYIISKNGVVRSCSKFQKMQNGVERATNSKEMCQYIGRNGYLRVNLSKGSSRTSYPVHRLVAQAFVPNPFGHPIVNHKNENKHDNRAENLEWCTNTYNLTYGSTQQRRVKKIGKKVYVTDLYGRYKKMFLSIREAARITGCPLSEVFKVCKGEKDHYKNYIFTLK